jgi:hypothetical protein
MKLRALGAIILFVAGLALGVLGYAAIDPGRLSIDTGTRDLVVLAVGAIVTALLALVAVFVAGAAAAKASGDAAAIAATAAADARAAAEAARTEARRKALIDRQRYLRSLIAARSARHTREIQANVLRRQELAGRPYQPLPDVRKTTEIEDAVVELYTLGFQRTADVAQALFNVLLSLDAYCFVATPDSMARPIAALSPEQALDCVAWSEVETKVRNDLMAVGLTDQGVDELKVGGTLEQDYIGIWFRQVRERLSAARPPAQSVPPAQPAPRPAPASPRPPAATAKRTATTRA